MALATSCCAQLSAVPNLNVALPNSAAYNATEHDYWSLQEASLVPSCIAKPTCAADVASIVAKLVTNNCHFAIKGRGHSPAAGFANIDHGITIDMTGLSTITVNSDHSVASVGAGASWLDVYASLDPLNKTVAGGRNGAVGVGGLTLGGGISYFSPQVGWTCDTVVNFEIVRNVFSAFVDIANAPNYDVHASLVTSLAYSATSKSWSLSSTPIYTQPVINPPVYKDLFAIPNITNTMHITPLHTLANETATPQINFLFYTSTFGPSTALLENIFELANSTFYDSPNGVTWLVTFEPLPTAITSRGAGQNVLGTSSADGNSVVLLLTGVWSASNATAIVNEKGATFLKGVDAAAEKMGLGRRFKYANYANPKQDVVGSYGEENEEFLEGVLAKYDPGQKWRGLVSGGFKTQT
ncbi:FAD-binding domain-containing protein [Setomelanomma holmii]|uniref:FAD-binding domain-containing protein n=1 Tax=Setomelanomma holmii TaxID=210430 RepID=A0A9P4H5Z9_9PLEO|nr:FAD-binding domain-containing protein [Setomelanomma holmii]